MLTEKLFQCIFVKNVAEPLKTVRSIELLKSILNFIKSRGVSQGVDRSERKLIELLNLICFVSGLGGLGISIAILLFVKDYIYLLFSLSSAIVYLPIVIFHHFNLIMPARIYFSVAVPIWITTANIVLGGNFSQSLMSSSTLIITYFLLLEKVKLRNAMVFFNAVLFIGGNIYSNFNGPLLKEVDYPFDELVIWAIGTGWLLIIFFIYQERKSLYINSLSLKNKELEQKTKELESFTYIASHDLKSPIRNIISFLDLMNRDLQKNKIDNISEYLSFARRSAHQMNELIMGVLEITKLDNNNAQDNFQSIDLNEILNKVKLNLQEDICDAEILSENLPSVVANESDFILVMQNLIQNGIKYNNSPKPMIHISVEINENSLLIHILDNGIGIEEVYYEQIFEFFKRLHSIDKYEGTGLGLGLCKKILQRYDGSIFVTSQLNKYSKFSIQLPIQLLSQINQPIESGVESSI